jgi:hypothetical protein
MAAAHGPGLKRRFGGETATETLDRADRVDMRCQSDLQDHSIWNLGDCPIGSIVHFYTFVHCISAISLRWKDIIK